jgi:hypothetical protein
MSNFIRLVFCFLIVGICLLTAIGSMAYSTKIYQNVTLGASSFQINNTSASIAGTGNVMVLVLVYVMAFVGILAVSYGVYGYITN